MSSSCYLAAFDLSDDRERRHVCKVLEGFGLRVQKSVFECQLNRSARNRMQRQLEDLKLSSGFCTIYKAGASFSRSLVGTPPPAVEKQDDHAFTV